jgi:predicted PurR-regulated permease PerM
MDARTFVDVSARANGHRVMDLSTRTPTLALTPMRVLAIALCTATALLVIAPLWAPLVLAAWCADLLRPVVSKLEKLLGRRRRGAAAVVALLALAVLVPIAGIVVLLVSQAQDLVGQVRAAFEGHGSLAAALVGSTTLPSTRLGWSDLLSKYGASAWVAASTVARRSASGAIAALVFVAALFTFMAHGGRAYAWLEAHLPVRRSAIARLALAFRETGRGLILAGGGTALVQGGVATFAYLAIGLPGALVLGPLTAACAVVPLVGTGLVWVPLTIELVVTGQYWRAGVVLVVGIGVHGLIDNFVRPALARRGRLALPTFVVLVSMLGGIAVLGPAGALLGPLLARLSVEALEILSDDATEIRSVNLDAYEGHAASYDIA